MHQNMSDGFVSAIDPNLISVKNDGKMVEISSAKISTFSAEKADIDNASIKSLTAKGGNLVDFEDISTGYLTVQSLSSADSAAAVE